MLAADIKSNESPVNKAVQINSDNALFNQIFSSVGDCDKQMAILAGFNNINLKDKKGFTVLHYACNVGDIELVKNPIEKFKTQIDETNLDKQTALHLATKNNHTEITKYLIEVGANIFAPLLQDKIFFIMRLIIV